MGLSDVIILNKGLVLVTQLTTEVIVLENTDCLWGEVQLVNGLVDNYAIGDDVLFNPEGMIILSYSGVTYNLISVDSILFKADLTAP